LTEAGGNGRHEALHFHQPPERVISLVPSLTESMFDLGLGSSLVGITDYCIYPLDEVEKLPRLGGPKSPRIKDIVALKPDLVLANLEENPRQVVDNLKDSGIPVWVSFPITVRQSLDVLWALVGIFRSPAAAARLETLELTLDWAISSASQKKPLQYLCPIWYDIYKDIHWWMTFNRHTYSHDLLHLLGCQNVFAERERKYPLEADLGLVRSEDPGDRDTRYPRVGLEEIVSSEPDLILLPSEPFAFDESHRILLLELFRNVPAIKQDHVYLVDGSLITWHGTRLAYAIRELPALLDSVR